MKTWRRFLWLPLLALAALIAPYVWPPDLTGRVNEVGNYTAQDGTRLRVVQYWNHFDFYTTLFYARLPEGEEHVYLIDGDDRKRWGCEFEPTTGDKFVRILFGGRQRGMLNLETSQFTRENGATMPPELAEN